MIPPELEDEMRLRTIIVGLSRQARLFPIPRCGHRPAGRTEEVFRTALWHISNRSPAHQNGNWKMAGRDSRGKTGGRRARI